MLTVRLYAPNNDAVRLTRELSFVVLRMSGEDPGGPTQAEIAVNGPSEALQELLSWLAYRVEVINEHGTRVWWGMLETTLVRYGAFEVGLTTEGLGNRVMVEYSTERVGGAIERRQTDWAQNTDSILRYGQREFVERKAFLTDEAALLRRDRVLAELSKPQPVIMLGVGDYGGTLQCRGYWASYDWVRYRQPAGLEAHEAAGAHAHPLGLGFASNQVGFNENNKDIHTIGGEVRHLAVGYKVRVTGSASNNGTHKIESGTSLNPQGIIANTISFTSPDLIDDSANGLGFINANDLIQIVGAANGANNRYAWVDNGTANGSQVNIDETPGNLANESAGAQVAIQRANSVRTNSTFTRELPGPTVTVQAQGVKMAQSFTISSPTSWTAARVALRARKVGNPQDAIRVELCANASGNPGAVLDTGTLTGLAIEDRSQWFTVQLSNTVLLQPGVIYWLVVSRTAANDWDDFYLVDIDEGLGYAGGVLRVWDGAAWHIREPDADMLFRVLGATRTTTQLREMAESAGWQISGVDISVDSGVSVNQYRAGDASILTEMLDLLDIGTSWGTPLQALITADRVIHIRERPSSSAGNDWAYTADGLLKLPGGHEVERGVLPVGRWLELKGGPRIADVVAPLSPFYCRAAEYDAGENRVIPDPSLQNIWEVGGLKE